jgi:hypothetical protein
VTARLELVKINNALTGVERDWPRIDDELARLTIGRKDPFTAFLCGNMLSAYTYLDDLVAHHVDPFSDTGIAHQLVLNHRVHYGTDRALMVEFKPAMAAAAEKFHANVGVIAAWYWKHTADGDHPYKLAAETYVSILGRPQLFIEGNHRTGALIASWINLHAGYPPFVLSVDNALAYFAPSASIKRFADRSSWRGRAQLPKYRKSFRAFWESHVDARYLRAGSGTRAKSSR